ncbi:MAG: tetratricopeptide repeat protein [Candidatus Cloacimonetes bacterium]|nr:tetratricopeptide repeat protein [Candidatus Cloacimonadota bacterium]
MSRYIFLIIILILSANARAQDTYIDSLESKLEVTEGKDRVLLLNELGKAYWGISSEKTIQFSEQALKLSKEMGYRKGEAQSLNNIGVGYYYEENYEKALAYFLQSYQIRREIDDKRDIVASLNNIGIIYDDLNKYNEALNYYLQSLAIYEELGDTLGIAVALHNIGVVYENLSNFNKALEYLLRALRAYEDIDDKQGIASSLGNIGIIYKELSNYDKAIEYHLRSLKISREIDDKIGVARSLDNIGIIYDNLGNYSKAIEYYTQSLEIEEEIGDMSGLAGSYNNIGIIYDDQHDYVKALEYYFKSLDIYNEIGDKNGIANSYNNIGVVYENIQQYQDALQHHLNAMAIFEDLGQKKGLAASLNNIGSVYLNLGNFQQALAYLQRSLAIAREIEIRDLVIEIYQKLSNLYSQRDDYRTALYYFKKYAAVKDSVFTKEKIERIAGIHTTYEVEQLLEDQEKEIELLQKDNEIYKLQVEKHLLIKWRLYSGLILVLLLVTVVFYLYRLKNKANIQLEKLVEKRTQDLQDINKQLKNEIMERKRIEHQLIRSERLAGVGELAAGVAHEIRNPLGNISSSAQFCLSKFKLNQQLKRYLEIILEDSEKANSIIKGLLDFASPRELTMKPALITDIIVTVLNSVKARCEEKNIKIIKDFASGIPRIALDKKWLGQAFMNFVINAIQAMPQGGILKVMVSLLDKAKEIQVVFLDNGTGISSANQKKIFDPFFTTREDGVGLGLSLAHQIVQDHAGQLHIESKLQHGTKVIISFPYMNKD